MRSIPVNLTQVKTRDGVLLDGIYVEPKQKSKTALIWLHGLTSYFHSSQPLIEELSIQCRRAGIGYFKFDTRGHDLVTRGAGKHVLLGTLFEKFEDCIYDIRAIVALAARCGYKNIILAGHSTGANKAVYYLYKTRDRRVRGTLLISGLNDIAAEKKRVGKKELDRTVKIANKLYRANPSSFFWSRGSLYTAQRAKSLFTQESNEDMFPYYNRRAPWKELRSVQIPLAVLIGARDEYLDRPAESLTEIFRKNAIRAKSFNGIIIKGAGHSFTGKEKELSKAVVGWIQNLKLC